jgi:hypothetical protein
VAAARHGSFVILSRGKAAIARSDVRRAAKDRDVSIERGNPQRRAPRIT